MSQFPQRKKNALDNQKMKMSAPCPSAQGKWSSLGWGLYKNDRPRITVYTNDPADSGNDNGMIRAPMGAPDFFALIHHLQTLCDSTEVVRTKIELMDFIFPGGKRSEKPVVVANLWVGRDEEGIIWMSPQSTDGSRPKIKFPFGPANWANWFNGAGEEYSKAELSKIYAQAYIKMISAVMEQLLVTEYKEPEQKNQNGGGGGGRNNNYQQNNNGGGQRNNNGGGGGGGQQQSFDDDLPF
jgi:hypothetical protein